MTIETKNQAEAYIAEMLDKVDFLSKLITGNQHINGDDTTIQTRTHMDLVQKKLEKEKDNISSISGMEVLIDELIEIERKKHDDQASK